MALTRHKWLNYCVFCCNWQRLWAFSGSAIAAQFMSWSGRETSFKELSVFYDLHVLLETTLFLNQIPFLDYTWDPSVSRNYLRKFEPLCSLNIQGTSPSWDLAWVCRYSSTGFKRTPWSCTRTWLTAITGQFRQRFTHSKVSHTISTSLLLAGVCSISGYSILDKWTPAIKWE